MKKDNNAKVPFKKFPDEQKEQILDRAHQMGLDERLVKAATFKVEKSENDTFTFTCPYFSFTSSYSGPSQEAMDNVFLQYGGVIIGGMMVAVGVVATGIAAAVALAASSRN